MGDSKNFIYKDQEKIRLKKRITRILTIFIFLQLIEFFALEAPNAFRELNESGYFSRAGIIFLLCLVAFIKLIKSLFSHYFLYITIMNALGLLFCDQISFNYSKIFRKKLNKYYFIINLIILKKYLII